MKLLIIDRDRHSVEMLVGWLKTLGHEVSRAYSAEQARTEWDKHEPELVLLDTDLEQVDGLVLCREMQQRHDALVLVFTYGTDVHDEIRCLQSGADDYLRKPFLPGQLLAHIEALSRGGRATLNQKPSSVIAIGPISVDVLHKQAMIFDKVVSLTRTESKLLHLLVVNANAVCTYEQIVSHIWGSGNNGDTGLIKAHIRHLRQKVEPDPTNPCCLLTVPGVGYSMVRTSFDRQRNTPGPTHAALT